VISLDGSEPFKVPPQFRDLFPDLLILDVPDGYPPPVDATFLRRLVDRILTRYDKPARVLLFCTGGHGRTGAMAAGLIAVIDASIIDPIRFVRSRYCERAIETRAQADWVRGILKQKGGVGR